MQLLVKTKTSVIRGRLDYKLLKEIMCLPLAERKKKYNVNAHSLMSEHKCVDEQF